MEWQGKDIDVIVEFTLHGESYSQEWQLLPSHVVRWEKMQIYRVQFGSAVSYPPPQTFFVELLALTFSLLSMKI